MEECDFLGTQKRNFNIILISNFIVAASTTMIMPFLSLYIETLGDFSESYVQKWAGLIFAATQQLHDAEIMIMNQIYCQVMSTTEIIDLITDEIKQCVTVEK